MLSKTLQKIERNQSNGTLLCLDDEGKLGRIYFDQGRVSTARYAEHHGEDALDIILGRTLKSIRFHQNRDMVQSKVSVHIEATSDNKPRALKASDIKSSAPTVPDVSQISTQSKRILRDALSDHLGPAAKIMVDQLDNSLSLKDAVNMLAHEIDDKKSAIKFVKTVRQHMAL